MCIRNGAWVIISKDRSFKQHTFKIFKSLRLWFFLVLVIFSSVPIIYMNMYAVQASVHTQVQLRQEELQYQCNILSKQMAKANFFSSIDVKLYSSEINMIANNYDGRMFIVNSSFQIVRDTYNLDIGKYDISTDTLACYSGNVICNYNTEYQYIELAQPIYDITLKKVVGIMVVTSSTQSIVSSVADQESNLRIMCWISCIVLGILSFFISGWMLKPFKKLSKAINQASFGNMNPIEVKGNVEVEEIVDAYNKTLSRLKHLDESRQEFVSNVSHELKTPITSVKVLADSLMSMEGAPIELYQEFLGDISNEINRETSIIEDLLTMVRLDKTENKINPEVVNINEMLEHILKSLKLIAKQRNIEVILESYRPVIAEVDEIKFSRAVTNLVENAIKYNKDDGEVRVSLNADHNYFYIKVVDTGVGIPDDAKDKIFERFYRVDKARSRDTGGTGLGLAITKTIIQQHHGMIRVHSELGHGSIFHIRIPLNYMG